ncbi:hypothetical protein H2200_012643 [Cladophialophora chaetospira]|uniref:Uncharacterized protein n=1 Tax=Cladophialophora chaetospira TaxID=386627 RepID=A0AA38WXA4_9EURO|nr:hypothetical protein H2200_012643 [Cladophialophora chaetospira]
MVRVLPNVGKEARVKEVIDAVSEKIQQHEPWVTLYHYWRGRDIVSDGSGLDDGGREIDELSRLVERREMPHHKAVAKIIQEEELLREPLYYSVLDDMGLWKR